MLIIIILCTLQILPTLEYIYSVGGETNEIKAYPHYSHTVQVNTPKHLHRGSNSSVQMLNSVTITTTTQSTIHSNTFIYAKIMAATGTGL